VPDQRVVSLDDSTRTKSTYPVRVVVIFLSLVSALLIIKYFVPDRVFKDMPWLLVLALIPVLPWVLVWAQGMFSSLKLGPVEMTFLEVKISVEDVANELLGISQVETIKTIATTMKTFGSVVVQKTQELVAIRAPFLPVHLGNGDTWVLPNLYFLAAMLESTTRVDLIVFTHSIENKHKGKQFLGSCSPESLRVRLGLALPQLETARNQAQKPGCSLQTHFWKNLEESVGDIEPQWITGELLANLLGEDLSDDAVEANEVSTKEAKLRVLFSRERFVPVVSGKTFEAAVIDQHGSALSVARSLLSR
jgi:hypothetical protein